MVAAGPLTALRRTVTLAAAVALAATGCGVLKAAEPETIARPGTVTTAPTGLSPGPYALTTEEGAVITFDLPTVPAPDDDVERLRQDLHVETVTYVELHIDNTRGTRAVQIEDLKVISHEGGQFPFQPAVEVLNGWDPDRSLEGGFWRADGTALDAQEGVELDARTHALISQYTGAVPAGAEGRELMIGEFTHLPQSFDNVELTPYPHERALDPAPVGHGPAQRQYRAGAPSPAPRERIEREQLPQPAAQPAVEQPAPAQPAVEPEPAPVYVPDCSDAAHPSGPVQQTAWNAACAPVQEPLPVPTQAPTQQPTQQPTQAPTQQPSQAPTQQPTADPTQAVARPTADPTQAVAQPTADPTQGVAQPSATPVDTTTIEAATGPTATPAPSASPARPAPTRAPTAPSEDPSSSPAVAA